MRLNRCGVPAAGGVLGKLDPIDEELDRRLGPLAMREDEEDDDGGVLREDSAEARLGVPKPNPDCTDALVRNLEGSGGRLATDVAGLAATSLAIDEPLLSERTRRKSASIRLRSLSVLLSSSRKLRQRERRSERRRSTVPLAVCRSLHPFSRV